MNKDTLRRNAATKFYICKDKYDQPMKDHLKKVNVYRAEAEDVIRNKIVANHLDDATN